MREITLDISISGGRYVNMTARKYYEESRTIWRLRGCDHLARA